MANNLSMLLDRIEMKLGTEVLNLPDRIRKNKWAAPDGPLALMTLPDFSDLFPHKMSIDISTAPMKNGWYLLDEAVGIGPEIKIIGVKDIDWDKFMSSEGSSYTGGYGMYLPSYNVYGADDLMLNAASSTLASAYGSATTTYVVFKEPNMIRLESSLGVPVSRGSYPYPIDIFVEHPMNLCTIPVSQRKAFFDLAVCDVASFLYEYLKYYEGTEMIFANTDLKLDTIRSVADERSNVYEMLKEAHVSAANANQPMMIAI